jgi:hypothetical protein
MKVGDLSVVFWIDGVTRCGFQKLGKPFVGITTTEANPLNDNDTNGNIMISNSLGAMVNLFHTMHCLDILYMVHIVYHVKVTKVHTKRDRQFIDLLSSNERPEIPTTHHVQALLHYVHLDHRFSSGA